MPDSTMLRQAAIGKLLDIQAYCNEILVGNETENTLARHNAQEILDLIKADR